MKLHSLKNAEIAGKKVLLRAGFDVEIADGTVTDTSRIDALVPTMKYILDQGASLIIMAHQGRPKGKRVESESQKPLVPVLERLLGRSVAFADSCTGPEASAAASSLKAGDVLLLENLRYDEREEKDDAAFAQELASLADVYVNDAFSNAHRKHASMVAVTEFLPSYAGLQLEQEVTALAGVRTDPMRPLVFIVSGAKMETKVPVIRSMLGHADHITVGGAIANTVLAANGHAGGSSLHEKEQMPEALSILEESKKEGNARIHLPSDVIVAEGPSATSGENVSVAGVPETRAIFDMGTQTVDEFSSLLKSAGMVVWNGPLGYYENPAFALATKAVAHVIADATKAGTLVSIVGGGDTLDFHTRNGLDLSAYTFVSTGGGAMLEFIAGETLPAVAALSE